MLPVRDPHGRPGGLEVEELLRVDDREAAGAEAVAEEREGRRGRLPGVVPALEGAHQCGGAKPVRTAFPAQRLHRRCTVADPSARPTIIDRVPTAELSALRAGDAVDGVFACTRKDRLVARTGTPYLALELRDRSGALPARVFRDADLLGGRFDRGDLVRVAGPGRALPRRAADRRAGDRARPRTPTPPRSSPSPTATSTSSTASSSTSRARSTTRATRRCWSGLLGDAAAARRVAPGAVHARRPPRLPRRAAGAHRGGRDARAGDVRPAPAAELRPADLRGARPRPRQDARVHLRRGDRADRRGPAARPRRARRAAARAVAGRARARPPRRARCTAC